VGEREVPAAADPQPTHHFWLLLVALAALLIGYPYFENSRAGAFLGGVTSLLTLTGAIFAVRTNRWTLGVALALALATVAASAKAFLGGVRGDWVVEATFTAFYAFIAVSVFLEVIKTRQVTSDTMYGAVCITCSWAWHSEASTTWSRRSSRAPSRSTWKPRGPRRSGGGHSYSSVS